MCCQVARLCLEATSVYFPNSSPQAGQEQCFRPQAQVFLSESLIQRVLGPTRQPFIHCVKHAHRECAGSHTVLTAGNPWDQRRWSLSLHGVYCHGLPTLPCLASVPTRSLSADFLVLTMVSLQCLPFVARLNSPMGAGRTVVVKGEVNRSAKGLVSLSY